MGEVAVAARAPRFFAYSLTILFQTIDRSAMTISINSVRDQAIDEACVSAAFLFVVLIT